MTNIYLDHFNIVLKKEVFNDLKNFISIFKKGGYREVKAKHSTWEGLYVFPKYGCLSEFTKKSSSNHAQSISLYFCNDEDNLKQYINKLSEKDKWQSDDREHPEGGHWFTSTKPNSNDDYFFQSCFDYSTFGRKRRNSFGIDPNNCISIETLEISVGSNIYNTLIKKLKWSGIVKEIKNEKIACEILNQNGRVIKINFKKKIGNKQTITVNYKMKNNLDLNLKKGKFFKFIKNKNNLILEILN